MIARPAAYRLHSGVGWLLAGCLLVVYAVMLGRYSVDFPAADDFTQILAAPFNVAHALTLHAKLKEIFSLAVEHRIATLRLAALVQAHLGGLDFRALMVFGSALLVLAGSLLVFTVDRDARPLFAAIAAALLLSPANYEGTLWATGALQHFGVVGYGFAALYCLSRPGVGWPIGAGVLAVAAACTSAGGLMVFPAGVLLLCVMRRWRAGLVWAVGGAALFGLYFVGYEAPPYQASLGTYLRDPLVALRFFFLAVGSLGIEPSVALPLGIGLCLFWLWVIGSGQVKSLPPLWMAWAVFLLLSLAAITWGRAGFGDRGALLSRYRVYSELGLLFSLVALVWQLRPPLRIRSLWVALAMSLVWFVASWRYELPGVERTFISRQGQVDYYVAEGHSAANDSPPADYRDFTLRAAKELGFYDPGRSARAPRGLAADARVVEATRWPSVGIEAPVVGKRVLLINAYGPGHDVDAAVWLESGARKYRGVLEAMPPAPLAVGRRTGILWGVYALAGVPPGRYRVGAGVDDRSHPTVWWTEHWIDIE